MRGTSKGSGWLWEQRHHAGLAMASLPVLMDTYAAYKDHKNVPGALMKSTFENGWSLLLTWGMRGAGVAQPLLAMAPAIPAIVTGVYGVVQSRNQYVRQVSRGFSQSYEHSDFAMNAQMRGLQRIGGARTMVGAEAGLMAQRYGRRSG